MPRYTKMLWWIWFFFCSFSAVLYQPPSLHANQISLERLYQDGKRLVLRKDYQEALRVFRRVLILMKKQELAQEKPEQREHWQQQRARLLYVIGRTSEYAALWADAYRAYRDCESLKPSDAMREAIRKRIQSLLPRISATLTLHTEPEQASIELIDAQGRVHQGKSPFTRTLSPGVITFSMKRQGYETRKRRISLEPLQNTKLFLELVPLQTAIKPKPPSSFSWRVPVVWLSVGLGIASSAASIALIAVSQQQLAAYDEMRASSNASQTFLLDRKLFVSRLQNAQSTEAASIGTFVGAGVFFALATAFFFWSPPKTSPAASAASSASAASAVSATHLLFPSPIPPAASMLPSSSTPQILHRPK